MTKSSIFIKIEDKDKKKKPKTYVPDMVFQRGRKGPPGFDSLRKQGPDKGADGGPVSQTGKHHSSTEHLIEVSRIGLSTSLPLTNTPKRELAA